MSTQDQIQGWRNELAETHKEIALLTNPETRDATAKSFGLDQGLVDSYLQTLHAQVRCLDKWIARASAKKEGRA